MRIVPEWKNYDYEIKLLWDQIYGTNTKAQIEYEPPNIAGKLSVWNENVSDRILYCMNYAYYIIGFFLVHFVHFFFPQEFNLHSRRKYFESMFQTQHFTFNNLTGGLAKSRILERGLGTFLWTSALYYLEYIFKEHLYSDE